MTKPLDIVANQELGALLKTQGFRKQARTRRRRAAMLRPDGHDTWFEFWQACVAHYHTMKTSALTIRLDRAPDRQLAMLGERLGVATSSKGFPQ